MTALDNCRDVVQVTDSHDRVIYENNSTEKVLGFSQSSDSEKALWDFQDTVNLTESVLPENDTTASIRLDFFLKKKYLRSEKPSCENIIFCFFFRGADLVRQKLDHGKAWEGPLLCRRKAGDSVVLDTRIIPVSFSTKRYYKFQFRCISAISVVEFQARGYKIRYINEQFKMKIF